MKKEIFYNEFGTPLMHLVLLGKDYMTFADGSMTQLVKQQPYGSHKYVEEVDKLRYLCDKGDTIGWEHLRYLLGSAVSEGVLGVEQDFKAALDGLRWFGVNVEKPATPMTGSVRLRCVYQKRHGERVTRKDRDDVPCYKVYAVDYEDDGKPASDVLFQICCYDNGNGLTEPKEGGRCLGLYLNLLVKEGFFRDFDVTMEGDEELVKQLTEGMLEERSADNKEI